MPGDESPLGEGQDVEAVCEEVLFRGEGLAADFGLFRDGFSDGGAELRGLDASEPG